VKRRNDKETSAVETGSNIPVPGAAGSQPGNRNSACRKIHSLHASQVHVELTDILKLPLLWAALGLDFWFFVFLPMCYLSVDFWAGISVVILAHSWLICLLIKELRRKDRIAHGDQFEVSNEQWNTTLEDYCSSSQ
jgi:hypothetical protein